MPSTVYKVKSCSVATKLRLKKKEFPSLEIRDSLIPSAGLGLFAAEPIKKNELITEYGGRVMTSATSNWLRLIRQDTHLRSVLLGYQALDSRVDGGIFTHEYYSSNHLAGGFANESAISAERNAVYLNERGEGHLHPSGEVAADRVFLKATRNIAAGEEILVTYGSTYRRVHYTL